MCFDHDSRPPIAPSPVAPSTARSSRSPAPTGTAFAAFRARPLEPSGPGDRHPARRARPPSLLRGARAAVRRAWHRRHRDRLVRPDRRRVDTRRGLRIHAPRPADDVGRHQRRHRGRRRRTPGRRRTRRARDDRVLHGRPDGVPGRDPRARPGRRDRAVRHARRAVAQRRARAGRPGDGGRIASPVLGLFGGADGAITADQSPRSRRPSRRPASSTGS